MCVPLPTVPCKCHSMPLQRRKRAQGQSAEAWGQSGCASKAVKTILYGWSLSNSLSQFNSCCMLKLKNKDNHWCLIILKLAHKRLFLCVLERRLGRRSNKGKSQQSDRIGQVWHTLLFIHCLSSAVLSSSVCAHTHTHAHRVSPRCGFYCTYAPGRCTNVKSNNWDVTPNSLSSLQCLAAR